MNIALIGYGKMGQTIEKIALQRGHVINQIVEEDTSFRDLKEVDVAIDFSIPDAAFKNITTCFKQGVPVVSGTTGWLEKYDEAVEICNKHHAAFIYASNFSLGVNIFFELNKKLAEMIAPFKQYAVGIEETHHTQKLDAPSGTAISLAEQIIEKSGRTGWKLDKAAENEIPIVAKRIENVPGTHTVSYDSKIDTISIEHVAHSREGFALGAVIAAEWIIGKSGVFKMKDVLF